MNTILSIVMMIPLMVCSTFGEGLKSSTNESLENKEESSLTMATFEILNKISAKRETVHIPIGQPFVMNDIRIIPEHCTIHQDAYKGRVYRAPVKIYLEQEVGLESDDSDAVELYNSELSSNSRDSQIPLEHAVYDLILKKCS